jgi:hypothetical protein
MSEEADGPIPIGERDGKVYLIAVKPPQQEYWESDRDYENREGEISITLFSRGDNGQEEIARIDNSHGSMHIHRFYSEEENSEQVEMGFTEALEYIYENWQHLADVHEEKKN